jgi:hypothetical protein
MNGEVRLTWPVIEDALQDLAPNFSAVKVVDQGGKAPFPWETTSKDISVGTEQSG